MQKMRKNKEGITLVSLVITIVILLILAGITISQLINSGLFKQAKDAERKMDEAIEEEQIKIKEMNSMLEPEWNGNEATNFARGTGTSSDPYIIENGEQLAYLARSVNNGNNFEGKYISIVNSINLGNKEFTPIAYGEDYNEYFTGDKKFQGTLDGNNNVITGLKIESMDMEKKQGVGLIGTLGNKGTVKNINIYEGKVKGALFVGGVVGASNGVIINCRNSAEVISVKKDNDNNRTGCRVGGIVGAITGGSVSKCVNCGDIIAEYQAGGGIIGHMAGGTLSDCNNSGKITAKDSSAGGIVGYIDDGNVSNCNNTGKISVENQNAGGILGRMVNGSASNCSNFGTISSINMSGGIVGWQENGTVSDGYNKGIITASNYAGGIIGWIKNGNLKNSYDISQSISGNYKGRIVGVKTGGNVYNTYYCEIDDSTLPGIGYGATTEDVTNLTQSVYNSLVDFIDWCKNNNNYVD